MRTEHILCDPDYFICNPYYFICNPYYFGSLLATLLCWFIFADMRRTISFIYIFNLLVLCAVAAPPKRIITLSGALSETVDALGLGSSIVAVDVTSIYPAYVKALPRVSKNRSVLAEGLMAFHPDLVLAPAGNVSPEVERQLRTLGVRWVNIRQE
ncbi:iron complex transport system substrate-binding protein [bacterium A37T11]|nr:iron complex transport system substrate-binding protein [bacterium A37T11]